MALKKEPSKLCECGRPGRFFLRGKNWCTNCIEKVIVFEKNPVKESPPK